MKIIVTLACCLALISFNTAMANTLRIAFDADPVSLDPHEQLSEDTLQFSHLAFDPLLRWKQNGQFEPRLATKWQRLDDRTIRFFLRRNVTFQTGHAFSAKDVVYTIERLKKSPDFRAMFDIIESVSLVDDFTVDVHTTYTNPLLLNIMAYVFPMDKVFYQNHDQIIKYGESFASRNVSGTGPFILVNRELGSRLELKRNPDYWDKNSLGNVDRIIFTPIRADSTRLAALLSGDVDFIFPVSPIDIERTKRVAGIQLVTLPSTRILLLHMNQARRKELRDRRVRKAINLAINQPLIVKKILKGYATPAGQLSPDSFLGHINDLEPEYNLAKALELMKQAGYEKGFRISMMAPNNRYMNDEKVAQAIAAMLGKIHIKVDLKTLPKAQYFQEFDQRSADIMMLGWQSDTVDSNNLFEFIIACSDAKTGLGAYNASEYCQPSINDDIRQANREMNPEKRRRFLQQIERTLHKDSAIVPLYWQDLIWAAKDNVNIQDIVNDQNYPYLGDLFIEQK
ncbi:ABC transporter substrate-binding protein [Marinomonas sp. M1K-6]|uniref:ABC transporter substrate-binding protein n=1 Tax=Marinomonas profundi TaxID=2726122 RepID=A0A847QZ01_9GAMM|nr:ABC transporter substrate-binding protein [Marinomonas profundi]NLQ16012.1 ABC transporter substrate-binding protein [Marinomonas profundi]UDV03394.1 ABC transporter substrate-binding protein [Marinomonas profundi]